MATPYIVDVISSTGSIELSGSLQKCIEISNGCFARTFGFTTWNKIRLAIRYRLIPSSSLFDIASLPFVIGFCHGTENIPGDRYVDHFLGDSLYPGQGISPDAEHWIFDSTYPTYATSASGYTYAASSWGGTFGKNQCGANTGSSMGYFFDIERGSTSNNYSTSVFTWNSDFVLNDPGTYYHYSQASFLADMQSPVPAQASFIYISRGQSTFTIDENASGSFDSVCVYWGITDPVMQILDLYVLRLA